MHKQIQTGQHGGQIIAKARQPSMPGQTLGVDSLLQLSRQRPLAEQHQLYAWMLPNQCWQCIEHKAVPLALNQLSNHPDQHRIRRQAEPGEQAPSGTGTLKIIGHHGAAHHAQFVRGQSLAQQHIANRLGDRDHAVMQPILDRHHPARLGIIHAAGMNHRHTGPAGGNRAHDIGSDAAMQMHQIRRAAPDQIPQASNHRNIQIAAHGQRMHLGKAGGALGQFATNAAGQQVIHALPDQPLQQIQHLLRTAVQIRATFYMQNSHHWIPGNAYSACNTSSTPMSRMQKYAPSQVGRRRQGEQCRR
jgi:hypothetical protein